VTEVGWCTLNGEGCSGLYRCCKEDDNGTLMTLGGKKCVPKSWNKAGPVTSAHDLITSTLYTNMKVGQKLKRVEN